MITLTVNFSLRIVRYDYEKMRIIYFLSMTFILSHLFHKWWFYIFLSNNAIFCDTLPTAINIFIFIIFTLSCRFECWFVECTNGHNMEDNGYVAGRKFGMQIYQIHSMFSHIRINLCSCGTQYRSIWCNNTSNELF